MVALLWIPAAVGCLLFVIARGSPVPYWDQFAIAEFLIRTADSTGYPSLSDLFAQHNESRKFFPRLIFWLLSLLGTWDVRREMLVNVAMLTVGAGFITVLARRTLPPWPAAFASVVGGTLLLSISQWQNLIWGIQIVTTIPTVALLFSLVVLLHPTPHLYLRVALAAVAAVVATFSYANGMALWPLLVPVLLLAPAATGRQRMIALAGLMVVGVASVGAYFFDYARPGQHPGLDSAIKSPEAAIRYFVLFVGNGLRIASTQPAPMMIGAGALAVVGVCTVVLYGSAWVQRSLVPLRTACPWLTLAAYTLLSAAATTAGRLGFGVQTALSERYVTFALPLFIALIPLVWLAARELFPSRAAVAAYACTFLAGALAALHLVSIPVALDESASFRNDRKRAVILATFIDTIPNGPEIATDLFPVPNQARGALTALHRLKKLPFPFATSTLASAYAPNSSQRAAVPQGALDVVRRDGAQLHVSGWAVSPFNSKSAADAVIIAARLPDGDARLLALTTLTRQPRVDIPQTLGSKFPISCGWFFSFDPPPDLPPDTTFTVFIYDAATHTLFPTGSDRQLPPP